jgi:hypothetical protein
MVPHHHAGQFLKGFFQHDITLIASVMGESAISHSSGGIFIPAKMAQLAKN